MGNWYARALEEFAGIGGEQSTCRQLVFHGLQNHVLEERVLGFLVEFLGGHVSLAVEWQTLTKPASA